MFPRTHLTLSFMLCVASCLGFVEQDEKTVTVTEKNNGAKISLAQGEVLIVELDAQPGTGFGWQVAKNEPDHLSQLGKSEFRSPKSELPGAIAHQVFRFRAQASGTSTLELRYLRPWEKNRPPAKTYRLEVHVK